MELQLRIFFCNFYYFNNFLLLNNFSINLPQDMKNFVFYTNMYNIATYTHSHFSFFSLTRSCVKRPKKDFKQQVFEPKNLCHVIQNFFSLFFSFTNKIIIFHILSSFDVMCINGNKKKLFANEKIFSSCTTLFFYSVFLFILHCLSVVVVVVDSLSHELKLSSENSKWPTQDENLFFKYSPF